MNSEIVVKILDTTEFAPFSPKKPCQRLQIKEGDSVWAVFNAASVVINVD